MNLREIIAFTIINMPLEYKLLFAYCTYLNLADCSPRKIVWNIFTFSGNICHGFVSVRSRKLLTKGYNRKDQILHALE